MIFFSWERTFIASAVIIDVKGELNNVKCRTIESLLTEEDAQGENGTSLTASANYKAQEKWDQLDISGSINRDAFTIGFSYRGIPIFKKYKPGYSNNDAFILILGVQTKKMKIGYSYDITISRLNDNSGGAHEISIIYEHYKKRRKRKRFFVPCAKF